MTATWPLSGTTPPALRATSTEHDSTSEDAPGGSGVDQHDQVAALVNRLRSGHPLDPEEIAFEAVHDALLAQRVTFEIPGPPTRWHLNATIVDIDGFENVKWEPATDIPVRVGDRRRLVTIGAVMALRARLRGQIAKATPLTSPAATYWAIDDHVTLHARAEICVDADTGLVKGAAVTIDPATFNLTGTAIHRLTQQHPTPRHDFPRPRPAAEQSRGPSEWSRPDTNRSTR